ncbi:MAG: YARHG domain-containing protein, partial [Clostridia bacterium]|nr:YARHG domain-containing protein [Clostridia bacterium]
DAPSTSSYGAVITMRFSPYNKLQVFFAQTGTQGIYYRTVNFEGGRHGYIFKLEEYRSYFMQQPWYSPRYENQQTAQSFFNSYEEANRIAIIKYEESRGWR